MTEPPISPSASSSAVPSNSTNASALGTAVAAVLFIVLSKYGVNLPAGSEAAVAGLLATLAGYLPKSGRIT